MPFSQTLESYSFDYSAHKVPIAYKAYGTTIELVTKTKLIPQADGAEGAYFLSKVYNFVCY